MPEEGKNWRITCNLHMFSLKNNETYTFILELEQLEKKSWVN